MQKQVHRLSACPSWQLTAALKHISLHHPMRVRRYHIPAGPQLSLGRNLMTWDNLRVQTSDAQGNHISHGSWNKQNKNAKTRPGSKLPPLWCVLWLLTCLQTLQLPSRWAIHQPAACSQMPLFPFVLQRGEFASSFISWTRTQDPHSSIHSSWLPVGPQCDLPAFDGTCVNWAQGLWGSHAAALMSEDVTSGNLFWPYSPLLRPRGQTCDGKAIPPHEHLASVQLLLLGAASVLKHLSSSFGITGTAYVCCIPVCKLFMETWQHEDAAHRGGRGLERGEGYWSAD